MVRYAVLSGILSIAFEGPLVWGIKAPPGGGAALVRYVVARPQ
ncbi:MAG TPA: hypothetical protein VMH39_07735 [Gemmatimonadaceae bacterium]|nr:hypothetical protein [Gemmatimonadaceae bacterium]